MKKVHLVFASLVVVAGLAAGCGSNTTQTIQRPVENSVPTQAPVTSQAISYQGVEGKNALELLKGKYQVETKEFAGVGEYVSSINGTAPDDKHFWSFYVNGQPAQVGAGQYVTKAGDSIEWKLEALDATK